MCPKDIKLDAINETIGPARSDPLDERGSLDGTAP